ncbi:Nuclear pore complex protein [Globisporangium polare]
MATRTPADLNVFSANDESDSKDEESGDEDESDECSRGRDHECEEEQYHQRRHCGCTYREDGSWKRKRTAGRLAGPRAFAATMVRTEREL